MECNLEMLLFFNEKSYVRIIQLLFTFNVQNKFSITKNLDIYTNLKLFLKFFLRLN